MQTLTLTFSAAVVMGFAFGAGPCNIACLPYLGPVFLARHGGIRSAWRTLLPFSAGRMVGYALLGALAGSAGQVVTGWAETHAGTLLGGATAGVGLLLLWRLRRRRSACHSTPPGGSDIAPIQWQRTQTRGRTLMPVGLFGMGAAMALNPCVPLGTVLLAAAATGQLESGLWLGFGFGVGAVLIPAVVFGVLVAHFGEQIRVRLAGWGRAVEQVAAGLLVGLGAMTAMGWLHS